MLVESRIYAFCRIRIGMVYLVVPKHVDRVVVYRILRSCDRHDGDSGGRC